MAPRQEHQGNKQEPNQKDTAPQLKRWVCKIENGQENAHRARHLNDSDQYFPSVVKNRGIVEVEIVHAEDKRRRDHANFEKSLFITELDGRVVRSEARQHRRQERKDYEPGFGNAQEHRTRRKGRMKKPDHGSNSQRIVQEALSLEVVVLIFVVRVIG